MSRSAMLQAFTPHAEHHSKGPRLVFQRPRPCLDDIRFKPDLIADFDVMCLDEQAFRALMCLVRVAAANEVWTYSAPCPGLINYTDKQFARVTEMSTRAWRRVKAQVLAFFELREGRYHLLRDFFEINSQGGDDIRPAIPAGVRSEVMTRDGWTCVYCGTQAGPFDIDHVIPYSRGGSNTSADNLVCACARCNRAKGARTPSEWISGEGSD